MMVKYEYGYHFEPVTKSFQLYPIYDEIAESERDIISLESLGLGDSGLVEFNLLTKTNEYAVRPMQKAE